MAYIIVHHQAADGKSLLVEILPRVTKMPVVLVTDGEKVKANHVYVVPAGKQVTMAGDAFRLSLWSNSLAVPRTFRSSCNPLRKIGKNGRSRSYSSGFDSDGAAALEPIKEAGGLVLAQKFQTASQPDMPQSAVKTNALINSCRRPISQSNWDALARSGP